MSREIETKAYLVNSIDETIEKIKSFKEYKILDNFNFLYKQDVYYSLDGKIPKESLNSIRLRKEGEFGPFSKKEMDELLKKYKDILFIGDGPSEFKAQNVKNTTYTLTMKEKMSDVFVENNKEYETTFSKPEVMNLLLKRVNYKPYFNKIKKSIGTMLEAEDKFYLHIEFVNCYFSSVKQQYGPLLETEIIFEDDCTQEQYDSAMKKINEFYEKLGLTDKIEKRSWGEISRDLEKANECIQ